MDSPFSRFPHSLIECISDIFDMGHPVNVKSYAPSAAWTAFAFKLNGSRHRLLIFRPTGEKVPESSLAVIRRDWV
jgi:hypothetical protein